MTFLGIDNRQDLPKVAYSTALDIFVAVSFVFVLTTIIQFAAVHFFTKYGTGEEKANLGRSMANGNQAVRSCLADRLFYG